MNTYTVESGDWKTLEHAASRVRLMVFVAEQKVPLEEEIDALDPVSTHFVVKDAYGMVVGCARMTPAGHIGRVAVLKSFRGRGVGKIVLKAVLDYAYAHGISHLDLNAQTHARGFYEAFGFVAEGEVFDECGIEHIHMVLDRQA